jgi:2-keto-4-pentenoate hydratase/2-oxohepta-3-ene-1,7-dioic acid hydratase in catechol pathway
VIGRRVRNVTPAAAARYIFGYTAAQDISDRTIQNAESQWARCQVLRHLHPARAVHVETKIDPHDLTRSSCSRTGSCARTRTPASSSSTATGFVSFISTNLTLLPGDVILTGTPERRGAQSESGDRLEVRIQSLAPLVNMVK